MGVYRPGGQGMIKEVLGAPGATGAGEMPVW
jgi:hypothetical protein